jgi:hypothetical protein
MTEAKGSAKDERNRCRKRTTLPTHFLRDEPVHRWAGSKADELFTKMVSHNAQQLHRAVGLRHVVVAPSSALSLRRPS